MSGGALKSPGLGVWCPRQHPAHGTVERCWPREVTPWLDTAGARTCDSPGTLMSSFGLRPAWSGIQKAKASYRIPGVDLVFSPPSAETGLPPKCSESVLTHYLGRTSTPGLCVGGLGPGGVQQCLEAFWLSPFPGEASVSWHPEGPVQDADEHSVLHGTACQQGHILPQTPLGPRLRDPESPMTGTLKELT